MSAHDKLNLIFLAVLLMSGINGFGSIPKKATDLSQILNDPTNKKWTLLKKQGSTAYSELKQIAFSDAQSMSMRWKAFMALARMGEKEALPEVKLALESSDWFMRDAALKVLPYVDKAQAYLAAIEALNDPALIVRSTAVETLKTVGLPESAERLYTELSSKKNFIKDQRLWIRRRITETLAQLAPVGFESKFIDLLNDKDISLHKPAIEGLRKLTALDFQKADQWKSWWAAGLNNKHPPPPSL